MPESFPDQQREQPRIDHAEALPPRFNELFPPITEKDVVLKTALQAWVRMGNVARVEGSGKSGHSIVVQARGGEARTIVCSRGMEVNRQWKEELTAALRVSPTVMTKPEREDVQPTSRVEQPPSRKPGELPPLDAATRAELIAWMRIPGNLAEVGKIGPQEIVRLRKNDVVIASVPCSLLGATIDGWQQQLRDEIRRSMRPESTASQPPPSRPEALPPSIDDRMRMPRLPEGVVLPTMDAASRAFDERSAGIAERTVRGGGSGPRLKDVSKQLDDDVQRVLERSIGSWGNGVTLERGGPTGMQFVINNGERWALVSSPLYKDQYPNGLPAAERSYAIYNVVDPLRQAPIDWDESKHASVEAGQSLFERSRPSAAGILRAIAQASSDATSEARDAAAMRSFDFPHDRPVGFVALINGTKDAVLDGMRSDLATLPQRLNALTDERGGRRYSFVEAGRVAPTASNRFNVPEYQTPAQALEQRIGAVYATGIRDVYVHLYGHGFRGGIALKGHDAARDNLLTFDDIATIAKKFPDARLTFSTVACFSGGMGEGMARMPDGGNVRFIMQTTDNTVAQEGRLEGEDVTTVSGEKAPAPFSTYYNVLHMHCLKQGMSFGEAHLAADRAVRRLVPSMNAQSWHGGAGTKGIAAR